MTRYNYVNYLYVIEDFFNSVEGKKSAMNIFPN